MNSIKLFFETFVPKDKVFTSEVQANENLRIKLTSSNYNSVLKDYISIDSRTGPHVNDFAAPLDSNFNNEQLERMRIAWNEDYRKSNVKAWCLYLLFEYSQHKDQYLRDQDDLCAALAVIGTRVQCYHHINKRSELKPEFKDQEIKLRIKLEDRETLISGLIAKLHNLGVHFHERLDELSQEYQLPQEAYNYIPTDSSFKIIVYFKEDNELCSYLRQNYPSLFLM